MTRATASAPRSARRSPLLAISAALALTTGLTACGGSARTTGASQTAAAGRRPSSGSSPGARRDGARESSSSIPSASHRRSVAAATPLPSIPPPRLAAFGSAAPAPVRRDIAATLAAFFSAQVKGRWAAACSYLAASVRAPLAGAAKGQSCAVFYGSIARGAPTTDPGGHLSLGALRLSGERAYALFSGLAHQRFETPLAREGGAWKVAGLLPSPAPPPLHASRRSP